MYLLNESIPICSYLNTKLSAQSICQVILDTREQIFANINSESLIKKSYSSMHLKL